MHYLFILVILFAPLTTMAQIQIDSGIRKPNYIQVAQTDYIPELSDTSGWVDNPTYATSGPLGDLNSLSADEVEQAQDVIEDTNLNQVQRPDNPSLPTVARPTTTPVASTTRTKQVIKSQTPIKVKRAIQDDRIDDSYVQDLVKDNFNFTPSLD